MNTLELYRRAQWRLDRGDPAGAVDDLLSVVAAEPTAPAPALLLARAYFHSAQLARAAEAYRRVIELDPADWEARIGLARSLERAGRPAEALPHARVAAALTPHPEVAAIVARLTARAA